MENTILSIIVPIYNGEQFIDRCVKIIAKEYQSEMELLLLDDGSKDNSWVQCEYWVSVYPWIRIFHHYNQGVSYTRNRGIEESKGKYIWFVDVDDVILPGSIASIIEIIKSERMDILLFGYRSKLARKQLNEFETGPATQGWVMIRQDISRVFWGLLNRNLIHNIGNKVYLREMLIKGNVMFDERLPIYEDAMFCVNAILTAESLLICDQIWYCYNLEENMCSLNHIYRENFFLGVLLLYENIGMLVGKTDQIFYANFLSSVLDVIDNEFRRKRFCYSDFKEFIRDILSDYRVQQALEQIERMNARGMLGIKWEKILNRKYYVCFLLFKFQNIKKTIKGARTMNRIFDFAYCMYKRFKDFFITIRGNNGN